METELLGWKLWGYRSNFDIMSSTLILFTLWKFMRVLMPTADVEGKKDQNGPKAVECSKTPVPNIPQVNRMISNSRYQNCSMKAVFERGWKHKGISSTTTVINVTSWKLCCTHCEKSQTHVWKNVKLHKRNEKIAIKAWTDLWFF